MMRAMKAHRLAAKSVLDRRKIPVKKINISQPPQPQTAFRRRAPVASVLQGLPTQIQC
jgi:hypothetical protein